MNSFVILGADQVTDYSDDRGNRIVGTPRWTGKSTQVFFMGRDCTLVLGENVNWNVGTYFKGDGGTIVVGDDSQCLGSVEVGPESQVTIGERLNVTGTCRMITDDGASIRVGDDCLFAENVFLRSYDHHPIYDLDTRERINFSRDITIGSDVWLGYGVTVLGGASVGHGAIVGTMSVVTASRPVGDHCLAAGSPASVKRERVAWSKAGDPPPARLPDGHHADCAARLDQAQLPPQPDEVEAEAEQGDDPHTSGEDAIRLAI